MKNIEVEKLTPEQKIQLFERLTQNNICENGDGYLSYFVYVKSIGFYCVTFYGNQVDILEADEEQAFRNVTCSPVDIDIEIIKDAAAYMNLHNPSIDVDNEIIKVAAIYSPAIDIDIHFVKQLAEVYMNFILNPSSDGDLSQLENASEDAKTYLLELHNEDAIKYKFIKIETCTG